MKRLKASVKKLAKAVREFLREADLSFRNSNSVFDRISASKSHFNHQKIFCLL